VCERMYSHMKAMCNFTVHGMQNRSKECYIIKRFVAYQFHNIMRNMVQNSACCIEGKHRFTSVGVKYMLGQAERELSTRRGMYNSTITFLKQ